MFTKAVRPFKGLLLRMRGDGVMPTLQGLVDGATPKLWHIYKLATPPQKPETGCLVDSDIGRLTTFRASRQNLTAEYFRDEAKRADQCFFAVADGTLAGIVWILDAAHPSRVIDLAPGHVELAYLYVEPQFRGRGIARALIQEACRVLPSRGITGVFSIIESNNLPSQKAFLASGFQLAASLRRPLFFGRRYRTAA